MLRLGCKTYSIFHDVFKMRRLTIGRVFNIIIKQLRAFVLMLLFAAA